MILNFIRKKIYQRTHFARQKWLSKKQLHKKNFFNYLNLEYKRYGTKNPNKFFYVIKRAPGAGFFSNLNFVIHNLYIAEKLKMIPVVDMENFQTFYNCKNKINNTYNSWEYYFKPVSNYKLSEVYKSKNVVFCDKVRSAGYNFKDKKHLSYFHGFQYLNNKHKTIAKKYIKINDTILKEANILKKKIFE